MTFTTTFRLHCIQIMADGLVQLLTQTNWKHRNILFF